MPAVVSQLPPMNEPILNKAGEMNMSWRRFFESQWKRTGGFEDLLYAAYQAANTGDATLAEVAAANEEIRQIVSSLTALVQGGLAETLQQEINDLRAELANMNAQIQGIRGEDATSQIEKLDTSLAPVAKSGAYSDLTGTPVLATVATTGAYADLTGKPTLGTAAAQNTGTSGSNVPLLNGANTWSATQTFSVNLVAAGLTVSGNAVVGTRKTGWTAATGTATRTTFATGTVTLPVLAEHVKALIDDLTTHGLIGT